MQLYTRKRPINRPVLVRRPWWPVDEQQLPPRSWCIRCGAEVYRPDRTTCRRCPPSPQ